MIARTEVRSTLDRLAEIRQQTGGVPRDGLQQEAEDLRRRFEQRMPEWACASISEEARV